MDISWLKWIGQGAIGFLGGVAAYFALPKLLGDWWLEKIKASHAKKLESLKTALEKSTFVTKAHFETEFAAMKEVSQCLAQVKILYRRLNPLEIGKELTGDALKRCITEFGEANDKFLVKLEEYGVFLTPAIYDEFERCHVAAHFEFDRFKTDPLNLHPKDKGLNAEHFWRAYREACQKVRDRISSLAVITGT
ncbi:MAG: hypothetical protein DMG65_26990 [Candidatus Angelobacter sp. Gp1-AA117]|nr:MAG: hypothetical protein DMG65_26990 [Candidatus Angelobacter sp. Gp1-AA117]